MAGRPKGLPKTGGRRKGTPNKATADIKAIAQQYGEESILGLIEIARDTDAPHAARVAAYKDILDRGYGKPTQSVDLSSTDGTMSPKSLSDFYAGIPPKPESGPS